MALGMGLLCPLRQGPVSPTCMHPCLPCICRGQRGISCLSPMQPHTPALLWPKQACGSGYSEDSPVGGQPRHRGLAGTTVGSGRPGALLTRSCEASTVTVGEKGPESQLLWLPVGSLLWLTWLGCSAHKNKRELEPWGTPRCLHLGFLLWGTSMWLLWVRDMQSAPEPKNTSSFHKVLSTFTGAVLS